MRQHLMGRWNMPSLKISTEKGKPALKSKDILCIAPMTLCHGVCSPDSLSCMCRSCITS